MGVSTTLKTNARQCVQSEGAVEREGEREERERRERGERDFFNFFNDTEKRN